MSGVANHARRNGLRLSFIFCPNGRDRVHPPDHKPASERVADPLTTFDTTALDEFIARLERSAQDLRARVALRAAALNTPAGAPRSDPLYQRLFFTLKGLDHEIGRAHKERSRRTST